MESKLRIDRKQLVHSRRGFRFAPEFSADRCNDQRRPEEAGHVDAFGLFQSLIVFTFAVMIPDQREMKPAGVMWIQLHCPPRDGCATIKIARMNQNETSNCKHVTVSWVQRDGSLNRCRKCPHIAAEKLRPGECFIGELAGSI